MPYRAFSLEEAANYLHLSQPDLERLFKCGEIPGEVRGGRTIFRKRDIDAWASQRILGLQERRLADYHQRSTQATQAILPHEAIMPDLIQPGGIDPAMTAKTKASVVRDMAALAEKTGWVLNPADLLTSLRSREDLCSTAIPGGVALLHPRHQQPYLFEKSFLVLGRTIQEIHFGAPDGRPTDLFVLVCCEDDRLHLHTLARLCLLGLKSDLLPRLRAATDAEGMWEALVECEREVLRHARSPVRT